MASVLNRITKQYLESVNTPNYNEADWIINPDLSGVVNVPVMYWKIVGDVISEMTAEEKAVVNEPARVGIMVMYNPDDAIVANRVTFIFNPVAVHHLDGVSNVAEVQPGPKGVPFKYLKFDSDTTSVIEMTTEEKANIDAFVKEEKSRVIIMSEIFNGFTSPQQAQRMVSVIDTKSSFLLALDAYNYQFARQILTSLLCNYTIRIEDIKLCDAHIPPSLM